MINVSVIVCVYNVPEVFLRKCVMSLLNQTLKNIEILVIDDGSNKITSDLCDSFKTIDSRIKVFHKKNGGLSSARNYGVLHSNGEYFTFVDGDDWIEDEALEESYYKAKENNCDILIWGTIKDYGFKKIFYDYNFLKEGLYVNSDCLKFQEYLLRFNCQIADAYSKLIKKDFVTENNIFHNEILKQGAEGLEFNVRLFEKCKRIYFLKRWYYHYMYNPNSISAFSNKENTFLVLECFKTIYIFLKLDDSNNKNLNNWFYNRMKYFVITTFISGIFHPRNDKQYKLKIKDAKDFLNNELIKKAILNNFYNEIDFQRRVILFFIKRHWFLLIDFVAKLRRFSKGNFKNK